MLVFWGGCPCWGDCGDWGGLRRTICAAVVEEDVCVCVCLVLVVRVDVGWGDCDCVLVALAGAGAVEVVVSVGGLLGGHGWRCGSLRALENAVHRL